MATKAQSTATIIAVFKSASDAEAAVSELKANGVSANDIHISSERTAGGSTHLQDATHHEGGFVGWFKRIFGDADESDRQAYENAFRSGNVLVSVDARDEDVHKTAEILNRRSPVDVHRETGGTATAPASPRRAEVTAESQVPTQESKSIPVVEEELRVGKRAVVRGSVRIYSRVTTEPVEETVSLREEKVRVERQPANRPATEAELRSSGEQVIEVDEYAEEPVVSKQPRVSEEVRVNKETSERTETVRDTLRRTEVSVEGLDREKPRATALPSDLDEDFRRDFTTRYSSTGENYETYAPAYRYGYEMASDPNYRGRTFNEVESDLRSGYGKQYPKSTWEKIKDSVRYGWDKVTGRATAARSR